MVLTSFAVSIFRCVRLMPATRGRASSSATARGSCAEPLADGAVLDRVGVALLARDRPGSRADDRVVDRLLEALLGVAVVGHHLGRPERVVLDLRAARDDVDLLRLDALDALDLVDVAADLDQSTGFCAVGELCVGDLVVPVAQLACAGHPQEKVGMADPPPVENGCLEDDVLAAAHRFDGPRCPLLVFDPRVAFD